MKKLLKLLPVVFALLAMGGALPENASASYAASGYPCSVVYFPGTSYYGAGGGGQVTLYSQPLCQGSYVGFGQFFSEGATVTCASDSFAATRHPAAMFSAVYQKLVDAVDRGQQMQLTNNACHQIGYIFFNGY